MTLSEANRPAEEQEDEMVRACLEVSWRKWESLPQAMDGWVDRGKGYDHEDEDIAAGSARAGPSSSASRAVASSLQVQGGSSGAQASSPKTAAAAARDRWAQKKYPPAAPKPAVAKPAPGQPSPPTRSQPADDANIGGKGKAPARAPDSAATPVNLPNWSPNPAASMHTQAETTIPRVPPARWSKRHGRGKQRGRGSIAAT